MAELPNSPPSAKGPQRVAPTGPVFHQSVAKVRVTSAGAPKTADFNGKTFTRDGEMVSASELGWDHAQLAEAEANPNLVVERFDKKGKLIKKDGTPYPTAGDLTPKPASTEAIRTVANSKPDSD